MTAQLLRARIVPPLRSTAGRICRTLLSDEVVGGGLRRILLIGASHVQAAAISRLPSPCLLLRLEMIIVVHRVNPRALHLQ